MRCNRYVAHHLPYSSWRFHQNTRLIASFGGTVEPLVHSPEAVHSARIGGIGVVDDVVVEHECAHARPFAMVGGRIGSAHGCELVLRRLAAAFLTRSPQQLGSRVKLYSIPLRCCSSVYEAQKSKLKSPPTEDAQG